MADTGFKGGTYLARRRGLERQAGQVGIGQAFLQIHGAVTAGRWRKDQHFCQHDEENRQHEQPSRKAGKEFPNAPDGGHGAFRYCSAVLSRRLSVTFL